MSIRGMGFGWFAVAVSLTKIHTDGCRWFLMVRMRKTWKVVVNGMRLGVAGQE